jgi:F420-dependent oxidoreductase-like protein
VIVRFSVWPGPGQAWSGVLELAQHAEQTGWDGVWFADHFMPNSEDAIGDTLECWGVLAALAAVVPRVRLGSLVCGNTYRHPAVLANMAATVDVVSGGRLVLGLGAGWQENEHAKYGIAFHDVGGRLARLEEACALIKALTTQERASFEGRYYRLDDAPLEPKPLQRPLPLLVGGGGEKVTLRIAATYADEWNTWGDPDILAHKVGVLRRHCEDVGRDPGKIRISAQALVSFENREIPERLRGRMLGGGAARLVEAMGAYADAGVDEFIVPDFNLGSGPRRQEVIDRFRDEVMGPLRP